MELLTLPPPPEAIAAMAAITGVQIAPTILATQAGLEGHLGPEAAGAILMLQATFADPDGAAGFWQAAVPLMALLERAPGFIRRYSFPDGPSITLLAFWRSAADARTFANTAEHRAAVRDLYAQRWQYSHFSAIWEMTSNHGRKIFCTQCSSITPANERACGGCGAELIDVYATT
ncbi:MAG: antibiotic biosynthesis monooxygenase family protein [Acidimicrobiales bacterium]